jgi:hypothetical protein
MIEIAGFFDSAADAHPMGDLTGDRAALHSDSRRTIFMMSSPSLMDWAMGHLQRTR